MFLIVVEKILDKVKKVCITLCLFLLYPFINAEKNFFFCGNVAEENSDSIFSSLFTKENRL